MNSYGMVYGGMKPTDDDEAIDTLEQMRPEPLAGTYLLDDEEEAARLQEQLQREISSPSFRNMTGCGPSPEIEAIKRAFEQYARSPEGRDLIAEYARDMTSDPLPVTRPTRDEFFFQMAELASTMATCPRAHCGAVIVRHKRPLSLGYNGVDEGLEHCPSEGEALAEHLALDHCLASTHAEVNAIKNAVGNVYGATIYVYGHYAPCINCKGELARVGITDIRHRPGQHYGVRR